MILNKNIILKVLIILISTFILVWLFPIKLSLPVNLKFIKTNEDKGETVILCHVDQVTGPLWRVKESYQTDIGASHINIVGNTPDLWLKHPVYCYNVDFLFIGEFVDETTFDVKEWKTHGLIFREYEMNPLYPPYGFNIFEMQYDDN